MSTLDALKPGSTARLVSIGGERSFRCRLMEMGLLPGTPRACRSPRERRRPGRARGPGLPPLGAAGRGEPAARRRRGPLVAPVTLSLDHKRVALAGNPNTGKTTLFNRLTGGHAKVGNYPGITVERQEATVELDGIAVTVTDVPGTYSLSARSAEEQIAIQAIAGLHPLERPDAVLLVADATQLTRNLYLALQIIEIDVPLVIALNMTDLVEESGDAIDHARGVASASSACRSCPIVGVRRVKGLGGARARRSRARCADPASGRGRVARWDPRGPGRWPSDVAAVGRGRGARERGTAATRIAGGRSRCGALLSIDANDELARHHRPSCGARVDARRAAGLGSAGREIETRGDPRGATGWIDEQRAALPETPRRSVAKPNADRPRRPRVAAAPGDRVPCASWLVMARRVPVAVHAGPTRPSGWIEDACFGWLQATRRRRRCCPRAS